MWKGRERKKEDRRRANQTCLLEQKRRAKHTSNDIIFIFLTTLASHRLPASHCPRSCILAAIFYLNQKRTFQREPQATSFLLNIYYGVCVCMLIVFVRAKGYNPNIVRVDILKNYFMTNLKMVTYLKLSSQTALEDQELPEMQKAIMSKVMQFYLLNRNNFLQQHKKNMNCERREWNK